MPHAELIRRLSRPLEPIPTDIEARCAPIDGIRAVLFDVYGTLLVSASGDISLTSGVSRGEAVGEALAAVDIGFSGPTDEAIETLHTTIRQHHSASSAMHPEVEIREIWKEVLQAFLEKEWIASLPADFDRLAIEYEMRVNPVWAMPGMEECLDAIRGAGIALGIVSNAQFFTPELFPAIVGKSLSELGFAGDLCIWSYEHRQAKPGAYLYEMAVAALAVRDLTPNQVLYIGNDMRNDIAPAAKVGFRTALFAGDARSLRLREGDPLVCSVTPDAVVTDLRQIPALPRLAVS